MTNRRTKKEITSAILGGPFIPDDGDGRNLIEAAYHFSQFMRILGYDFDESDELRETPARVALMYDDLFTPKSYEPTVFVSDSGGMVIQSDIPFASICAHHFLPYQGLVDVGYIPNGTTIGLSKIARAIAWESSRPTGQEDLTEAILKRLINDTRSDDVMVCTHARHLCMEIRGVKATGTMTHYNALSGAFKQPETRSEFVQTVRDSRR